MVGRLGEADQPQPLVHQEEDDIPGPHTGKGGHKTLPQHSGESVIVILILKRMCAIITLQIEFFPGARGFFSYKCQVCYKISIKYKFA